MAQELSVDCPSGLSVTVREFRVSDEDLLANPASIRKGLAVSSLLEAVTLRVDDPGPYSMHGKDADTAKIDWTDVLQGDRMVMLLKTRIFTWGEDLVFRQPCPNCPAHIATEIDLSELEIKPLPETSKTHVLNPKENPIFVTLPRAEVKVGFRLLRGKDERQLQKLQKQHKDAQSSAYLRYRIVEIDGVNMADWTAWLRNLGGSDAAFLRAQFDEADCGVDQEVDFDCDTCSHVWRDDVRFRADFLFPKYRKKTGSQT